VYFATYLPTFRRNVLPPPSGTKSEPSKQQAGQNGVISQKRVFSDVAAFRIANVTALFNLFCRNKMLWPDVDSGRRVEMHRADIPRRASNPYD
jgi:hypothetical protein